MNSFIGLWLGPLLVESPFFCEIYCQLWHVSAKTHDYLEHFSLVFMEVQGCDPELAEWMKIIHFQHTGKQFRTPCLPSYEPEYKHNLEYEIQILAALRAHDCQRVRELLTDYVLVDPESAITFVEGEYRLHGFEEAEFLGLCAYGYALQHNDAFAVDLLNKRRDIPTELRLRTLARLHVTHYSP